MCLGGFFSFRRVVVLRARGRECVQEGETNVCFVLCVVVCSVMCVVCAVFMCHLYGSMPCAVCMCHTLGGMVWAMRVMLSCICRQIVCDVCPLKNGEIALQKPQTYLLPFFGFVIVLNARYRSIYCDCLHCWYK